jgi:hypothetical protein
MTNKAQTPDDIEHDVALKRAEVAANIKQLKASVSLGSVAQQIGKLGLRFTGGMTSTAIRQFKQNPLPVATIAVGVAWLILGKTKSKPDAMTPVAPTAAADDLSDLPEQSDTTTASAAPLHETTEPETNLLTDLFKNHPFVVGALALAAGAVIGSAFPKSKVEEDLAASTQDLIRAEKERLAEIARKVKEEATNIFGETKDNLDSGAPEGQTAAQAIGEHAKGAADRMMSAVAPASLDAKTGEN